MGKISKNSKITKNMTDIDNCRKTVHLKRSKSVRASLRYIGTKFLNPKHHHHHHPSSENVQENEQLLKKSPSMSSLHDYNKRNYFLHHENNKMCREYPDYFQNEPTSVETILKTPMVQQQQRCKKLPTKNKRIVNQMDGMLVFSSPPSIVPPKAAAILHIPQKENCEPSSSSYFGGKTVSNSDGVFLRNTNYCRENCYDEFDFDYRRFNNNHNNKNSNSGAFHRTSLRLSITSKRRNNNLRNSSFSSSVTSTLCICFIIYFANIT